MRDALIFVVNPAPTPLTFSLDPALIDAVEVDPNYLRAERAAGAAYKAAQAARNKADRAAQVAQAAAAKAAKAAKAAEAAAACHAKAVAEAAFAFDAAYDAAALRLRGDE
jgi:hypothetical protein